jgi:hypothetical protein
MGTKETECWEKWIEGSGGTTREPFEGTERRIERSGQ